MNVKRFFLAALLVFVAGQLMDFLIHGVILMPAYEATANLWRPDMESYMWIMHVVGFVWSFLLVYIFVQGYQGRGIMEGVRFGFIIGLFVAFPMAYGTYAMIAMPYSLALQWFLYTLAECVVLGAITAALYKLKLAA